MRNLQATVKSVDISVRIHPKALIGQRHGCGPTTCCSPHPYLHASTPVEDGGSMMQALLRLNIVEPIVQEMP